MKINHSITSTAALAFSLFLAGCAPEQSADAAGNAQQLAPEALEEAAPEQEAPRAREVIAEAPAPAPAPIVCATCGVVKSVTAVQQEGRGTGIGAVAGAVVGGVVGNQIGGGSGRKIATAAGAIGGAVLGNNLEKNRNSSTYYEVVVDMEGGGQQFVTVPDASGIGVGSRVTVQGGNIALR